MWCREPPHSPPALSCPQLGPRFELRLFELRRGGMDEVGEPEFVLRPYMNSAKRRRYL